MGCSFTESDSTILNGCTSSELLTIWWNKITKVNTITYAVYTISNDVNGFFQIKTWVSIGDYLLFALLWLAPFALGLGLYLAKFYDILSL